MHPSHQASVDCKLRVQVKKGIMIFINSYRLSNYIWPPFLACRKKGKIYLSISTMGFHFRLQLLTKVCYRVAQLHISNIYSLAASIYIQIKRIRKVGLGQCWG